MEAGVPTQRPTILESGSGRGFSVHQLCPGLVGASALKNQHAWRNFLIKIAIYWVAELVICRLDGSRFICSLIAKGFWPCLATFALMDFLVLPKLRQLLIRRRQGREL